MSYKKKGSSSGSNKAEYRDMTPRELIDCLKKYDCDNYRLTPIEADINSVDATTFFKLAFITEKGERSEEQIAASKYKKPVLDADATDAQKREHGFLPDNIEVNIQPGDSWCYASCKFARTVTTSALKFAKKNDGKGDDKKEGGANKFATLALAQLSRDDIKGGDYVSNYTNPVTKEEMTDEEKGQEDIRVNTLIDVYTSQTADFVEAILLIDIAWRKFTEKLKRETMLGCKKDTTIFTIAKYTREETDSKTKKTKTLEMDQPMIWIKVPIVVYDPSKHGALGKKSNGRVGKYLQLKKNKEEKFQPVLFDGKKFKADDSGSLAELMFKSVNAKTGKKELQFITTANMSKAVTPKSLIGGTVNLFESNMSTFGLAPRATVAALFVRRHQSEAKFSHLDPSMVVDMYDFDRPEEDSDDEYERPDKKTKSSKSSKKTDFKKGKDPRKRGSDSDDSEEEDPKPKKSNKTKKSKKDESASEDESEEDAKPKKGKDKTSKKSKKDESASDGSDEDAKPKKGKSPKAAEPVKASKPAEPESGGDSDTADSDDDDDAKEAKEVDPPKPVKSVKAIDPPAPAPADDDDDDDDAKPTAAPAPEPPKAAAKSKEKEKPKKKDSDEDEDEAPKKKDKKAKEKKPEKGKAKGKKPKEPATDSDTE